VESAGDPAERLLDGAGIVAAQGVARVADITRAGPRWEALLVGDADLAASLGLRAAGNELAALWLHVQSATLVAARAAARTWARSSTVCRP
jgi:citrate lyase subunit beta/citryl-CoA lyase